MTDPLDVTEFRFRGSNHHNRDMLEHQAEKAFSAGNLTLAGTFAQAAALYAIAAVILDLSLEEEDDAA
jgi:hypothetical protein